MAPSPEKQKSLPSPRAVEKKLEQQQLSWRERKTILEAHALFRRELAHKIAEEEFSKNIERYPEKARDPLYRNNLERLRKLGLAFDAEMIRVLILEKGRDTDYMTTLGEFYRHGAIIDAEMIKAFTLLKAKNSAYVATLKELATNGIRLNANMVGALDFRAIQDKNYLHALKFLQANGIEVGHRDDEYLSGFGYSWVDEKVGNERYLFALKELHDAGVNITRHFIVYLWLPHALDRDYVEILKDLTRVGIDVSNAIRSRDFYKDAKNPRFIETLKKFHRLGVKIDDSFVQIIHDLDIGFHSLLDFRLLQEMAEAGIILDYQTISLVMRKTDPQIIDFLKDIAKAKITVNKDTLRDFTTYGGLTEKAKDPTYLATLKKIREEGVPVTAWTIMHFTLERAKDKKEVHEYVRRCKIIYSLFPDIEEYEFHSLWSRPEYLRFLQVLHKTGFPLAVSGFAEYSPSFGDKDQEVNIRLDPGYIAALKKLYKEGITFDPFFVSSFSPSLAKDPAFVEKIIRLHREGIEIDHISLERIANGDFDDPLYLTAIRELKGASIDVKGLFFSAFSKEHAHDRPLLEALKRYQAADIEVASLFHETAVEKIKNPAYFKFLAALRRNDMYVESGILLKLTLEDVMDPFYLETLVDLHNAGIKNLYWREEFSRDRLKNKIFVALIRSLVKAHIPVYKEILEALEEEGKINDKNYITALIKLGSAGVRINHEFIKAFKKVYTEDSKYMGSLLRLAQAKMDISPDMLPLFASEIMSKEQYQTALIDLRQGDIFLDKSFLENFTEEMASDDTYRAKLKELQQGAVSVNGVLLRTFTREKAKIPGYVEVLKNLRREGIRITADFIHMLTPEKAIVPPELGDKNIYITTLKVLHRRGVFVDADLVETLTLDKGCHAAYLEAFQQFHQIGLRIDGGIIIALTLEKATNKAYREGLKKLIVSGVDITHEHISYLDLSRGGDTRYLTIFQKVCFGKFIVAGRKFEVFQDGIVPADKKYLVEIQGLSEDEVVRLYEEDKTKIGATFRLFYEFKRSKALTPVSMTIVERLIKKNALPFAEEMNDQLRMTHEPEKARELIKDLPLEAFYAIVVHGAEELYTTNFRDVIFPFILQKMKEQSMDGVEFLNFVDPEKQTFRIFLQVCSKFNKIREFLATIPDNTKKTMFLKDFMTGLDAEKDGIKNAIAIAETLTYVRDDIPLTKMLEEYLKDAYETVSGGEKILYGLIGSIHEFYARTYKEFFEKLHREYPMEHLESIPSSRLVNRNKEIIQQYFFYNDEDGRASYGHFMSLYKADPSWRIEDHKTYVLLRKKHSRSGVTILKYANKPEFGNAQLEGMEEIKKSMGEKDLSTIQIVHRGHSYHVENTLKYMPKTAAIVYLGSCGGFHNVDAILNFAKQAHIIATKGSGTMAINDPLIKLLDEVELKGKGVVWNEVWVQATEQFKRDPRWFDYINPAYNTSVHFINAFRKYKLEGKD